MPLPETGPQWRLGVDMVTSDNILDGVTFDDLILAAHCNCRVLDEDGVWNELTSIIRSRVEDLLYLVRNNMEEILAAAADGRE